MLVATKTHQAPKLIIADDDPAVVKLVADRCERMGFQVSTVSNGMQLLVKVRQNAPDLLVVDVNMPQLDGLSASAHMLERNSHRMDIIVMTSSSSEETVERCDSLGLFYCRKGPDFWVNMETALTEIFPHLGQSIRAEMASTARSREIPHRPRILIVDDDPAIGAALSTRLAKYGVETLHASNATQALRTAVKQRPSAIVTDFEMPDGDAQHLIARLRTTPGTERIPVLVLSGHDIDDVTARNLRREVLGHPGASAILKKTLDLRGLFEALDEFCAMQKSSGKR